MLDVPQTTPVFTHPAPVVVPPWSGRGRQPTVPRLAPAAPPPQTVAAVAASLPPTAWQDLTVAEGAQGPRTYQFVALHVWESRDGPPGRACWLLRRNLDGSEPRYYLSNAPEDMPLLTLAQVAAARWVMWPQRLLRHPRGRSVGRGRVAPAVASPCGAQTAAFAWRSADIHTTLPTMTRCVVCPCRAVRRRVPAEPTMTRCVVVSLPVSSSPTPAVLRSASSTA